MSYMAGKKADEFGLRVLDALGIDATDVSKVVVTIEPGSVVRADVTRYITTDEAEVLGDVFVQTAFEETLRKNEMYAATGPVDPFIRSTAEAQLVWDDINRAIVDCFPELEDRLPDTEKTVLSQEHPPNKMVGIDNTTAPTSAWEAMQWASGGDPGLTSEEAREIVSWIGDMDAEIEKAINEKAADSLYSVILRGGERIYAHKAASCKGDRCTIHRPSDHHMRAWRQHWRMDRGIMERICEHGVGHPDPDDYRILNGLDGGVHGCDGCCRQTRCETGEVTCCVHPTVDSSSGTAWCCLHHPLFTQVDPNPRPSWVDAYKERADAYQAMAIGR